jgi:hypothetical protein
MLQKKAAEQTMLCAALGQAAIDPATLAFYRRTLALLNESAVPFLVGGAYALARYTGIERHTKDIDVFLQERDCERALQVLAADGCRTEVTFPHWLAKAYCGTDLVDLIFSSGNAVAIVDDEWFEHAVPGQVLDTPVQLCPPEEMIWSKSFVWERERFDGADIAHLLRACGDRLDWNRMLGRFADDWRVLLTHLILYGFIYPAERARIPPWVMRKLIDRLYGELDHGASTDKLCQGTLISRAQYLIDIETWGYRDARLERDGLMTAEEVARWTAAIGEDV